MLPGLGRAAVFALALAGIAVPPLPAEPAGPAPAAEEVLERAFTLDEGRQVPRDAAAAASLYQIAADQGDAFAHLRLGYLAETGDGVPQSYPVARAHYQAAADAGLKEARLRLAICHLEGWGGPVDRAAFVREMRIAAEAGDVPAQQIMSTIHLIGFAVPKDPAEALRWIERAAASGRPDAQFTLGIETEEGRHLALMPDLALARTWYQLSAEQEYFKGMLAMARTFLYAPRASRNWTLGRQWLQLAAENGDAEAPYVLAVCEMLHIDAPTRDETRARAWLRQASERGNWRATEVLQAEAGGRSLTDAMRYVLSVPMDERYIVRAVRAAARALPGPDHGPELYRTFIPIYPASLFLTRTTGQVLVEFIVDTTGRVLGEHALSSSHPRFTDSALEAVRQWRFHPARMEGRLVNMRMRVPILFSPESEQLDGVDGILSRARFYARENGPEATADAVDLRLAEPVGAPPSPTYPDGRPLAPETRAMVLLVLDEDGRPERGYVLEVSPQEAAAPVLASALQGRFKPRLVEGQKVRSNVILVFAHHTPEEQVFRRP